MKKIVVSGKTIEDAVRSGLAQWNVTEERVKVSVLEQPARGLFGLGLIGVKEAKVELELIPDPTNEAEQFLLEVASAMGLSVTVERKQTREGTQLSISGGGDLGMLIGRRGQTLDALQYLVNIVANRYSDSHLRIVLDAEDFRERRRKTLEELSERLAGRVIRTRKEVVLEPMSPHERKVIHSQLQNHPRVKTYSKGDEPNRRVVIALKEKSSIAE
ncbi:RNA-binding cell elongation regulator Jag/EloR [Paenibacillus radicis (ex Gao et al. 2016)]|uniref:RNA-binding protein KhpB n=1 Tax=Paenibacillus radicis (ex Gao et al. 2016) TaxID=1737354 RepID=A0A917H8H8_9BACL|nr:RNA-binding cell elongation regulator Jag/EloR [Paenibacillus radicis (ex Gao et al. 2016)]GGG71311.1 DNA-binding protein [Paenibacillus radicis (ex Gao et al. 2016)]